MTDLTVPVFQTFKKIDSVTGKTVKSNKEHVVFLSKNVKGWECRYDINEAGKISIKASKNLGKIRNANPELAKISITVESTENRLPPVKETMDNMFYVGRDNFYEIQDGLNRTAPEFKDENYKRQWENSSIITESELWQTLPFEALLQIDTKEIEDSLAKVQEPYDKRYLRLSRRQ
jgi:hypothetical protein